jgi:protocatechuate 3,4-dioxygenase beta subunit
MSSSTSLPIDDVVRNMHEALNVTNNTNNTNNNTNNTKDTMDTNNINNTNNNNNNNIHNNNNNQQMMREVTPTQVWGPFYVANAPFRAKISPVWAQGEAIVMTGTVYGQDGKPLPFATIDIWQTSVDAEYDYYEPDQLTHPYREELNEHGKAREFLYRARLITDEHGNYEYETLKPKPYFDPDDSTWRTSHIHYYVQSRGYKPLVTQMYFAGEDKNKIDRHIRPQLIVTLQEVVREFHGQKFKYYTGHFDLTLACEQ